MPDVLIFADSVVSPEMRHEVPVLVPGPVPLRREGRRRATRPRPRSRSTGSPRSGIEAHPWEEFGYDELIGKGIPRDEIIWLEHQPQRLPRVRDRGRDRAPLLPGSRRRSPARKRDHAQPDHDFFADRRRVKTEAEIAGIRRAQRAAEAGMGAAKDLLAPRRALERQPCRVDGEPLTVELLKAAIRQAFTDHGMSQRRLHRLARRADGDRPRARLRPDRARRAGRDRPLAKDPESALLRGHDPDVRGRRRRPTSSSSTTGSSRRRSTARFAATKAGVPGRRRLQPRLRVLRGARAADGALEGARRGARERVLPRARPRSRPRGARGARHGPRLHQRADGR